MHPVRFNVDGPVPFLQKDDVADHIRTGVGLEGVVGQADRAQQLRPLRDVLTDFGRLFVHRIAGGHKGDHAAGSNLVERLGKKVVVNGKTELVVSPVVDLVLSKGHVADGKVEEIPSVGSFKARHGNIRLGIELLGDSAGDAVQLHTVQAASLHLLREKPKKVPDAHGRLQDVAGLEAHVAHRLINRLDDRGAGVMGVQRGRSGSGVLLRGKCGVQLCKFVCPIWLVLVEGIRKTAPAYIAGENFLLLRGSLRAFKLQFFQEIDGNHIRPELGFCAADAQLIVHDAEVFRRRLLRCRRLRLGGADGLDFNIKGKMIFLAGVERYGFRGKLRLLRFCYFRWCLFRLGNFRLLNGNGLFSLRLCPALRLRFLQKNGAQHGSGVRP